MVSLEQENIFQLREYYLLKIGENIHTNTFKNAFLSFLNLYPIPPSDLDILSLSLYERCAIDGLKNGEKSVSESDLMRLLGQASKIDSTPRPWVSDFFGVMAIKWCVAKWDDQSEINNQFRKWVREFLPQQITTGHTEDFEKDIAIYILDESLDRFKTATIPLFLHYTNIAAIDDHRQRQNLIKKFMVEFKNKITIKPSILLMAMSVFVFDEVNQEVSVVPPNGWSLDDLISFLDNVQVGLRRWTWEINPRTANSIPVKWLVQNEYHVQNLLYILLAPIFIDVADEIYLPPLGQKTPRIDLFLPSMHTIIEVKYRKDNKKSFQSLIGEIAEDASLYRADPLYEEAKIICVLWDNTCSTQEHTKFKEGVLKIKGISACVVINSPSMMLTKSDE